MGRALSIPILGLLAALSASILPQLSALGISVLAEFAPVFAGARGQVSVILLVVMCWAVRADVPETLLWAFVGGLMLDIFSLLPLGASSAALALLAYFVNSVTRQLSRARIVFLLLFTPAATAAFTAYTLLWLALLGNSYDTLLVLQLHLLPTILFNLLALPLIYALTRLLQRRLQGGLQIAPQSLSPAGASGAEL